MALNVIHKINNKLKFLYRKNDFLTATLRHLQHWDALKHISHEEFEHLNWLPVTYRFKQCVISIVFKYFNEQCRNDLNEVFDVATENNFQLINSFQKLKCPFPKTNNGQYALSYFGPPLGTNPLPHSSVVTILIPSNIILKNIS